MTRTGSSGGERECISPIAGSQTVVPRWPNHSTSQRRCQKLQRRNKIAIDTLAALTQERREEVDSHETKISPEFTLPRLRSNRYS